VLEAPEKWAELSPLAAAWECSLVGEAWKCSSEAEAWRYALALEYGLTRA
jgi:hypothetical protein